jgi:hypothetical protein
MNSSRAILLFVLLLLAAPLSVAQKHFFFEQRRPFKHPVKLPGGALQLLRREIKGMRGCGVNQSTNIASWFKASRIDLGANRRAFIVRSYQDCLNGVDNDWFWIVLKTPRGYQLLLHGGTISLTVRTARTRGFPDIETNAATAEGNYTDIYEFDGAVYKAHTCTHTSFSTGKPERVSCRTQ